MMRILLGIVAMLFLTFHATGQAELEFDGTGLLLPRLTVAEAGLPDMGKFYYASADSSLNIGTGNNWLKLQTPFQKMGTTILPQIPESNFLIGLPTIPFFGLPITGNTLVYHQTSGALRGGSLLNSAAYDIDSLGDHSIGYGLNVGAKGRGAMSVGNGNIANGNYSISLGSGNEIWDTGTASGAIGQDNLVIGGSGSMAIGHDCTVLTSSGCIAMGSMSTVSGVNGTIAIGNQVTSEGDFGSFSAGSNIISYADSGAVTLGHHLLNTVNNSTVLGRFNEPLLPVGSNPMTKDDPLFILGNGSADGDRSNAMVVLSRGWTGMGTNTPEARLHLESNSSQDHPHLILKENNFQDPGRLQFHNTNADSNFWAIAARPRTNINEATAYMNFYYSGLAQNVLRLTGDGDAEFSGTVTASCGILSCSDRRFKKNIQPIYGAAQKLMQLNGIYFNWQDDTFADRAFGPEKQVGIIAQELEQVFPELVHTDVEGYKTVAYDRLGPILLEAFKSQQRLIDQLNRENHTLKQMVRQVQHTQEMLAAKLQSIHNQVR